MTTKMGRHKEWRKLAKKARRKRIRRAEAILREKRSAEEEAQLKQHPDYQAWILSQQALEEFAAEQERQESLKAHALWEQREVEAQKKWAERQALLAAEEAKRQKEEALIRAEWEKEQAKVKEEEERSRKEEEEKKKKYDDLMLQMDAFIRGDREIPQELRTTVETKPEHEICPFFSKVASCRYKYDCSRNHIIPSVSNTLLMPGFYSHFMASGAVKHEYDTDVFLEYEVSDRNQHFKDFYFDIKSELENFGRIEQLRVCSNTQAHLRGHVYVSYATEREAVMAYRGLNGRFYAGKQISVEFVSIPSWRAAICGLQFAGKCPKGDKCNFLHVFRNPGGEYSRIERPERDRQPKSERSEEWRWSESPEREESTPKSRRSRKDTPKSSREESTPRSRRSRKDTPKSSREERSSRRRRSRSKESARHRRKRKRHRRSPDGRGS